MTDPSLDLILANLDSLKADVVERLEGIWDQVDALTPNPDPGPDPDPGRRVIFEGPRPGEPIAKLDNVSLHDIHGAPTFHGSVGAENLRTSPNGILVHRVRGGGHSIVADRALAWFALPGARNPKAPADYGSHDGYNNADVAFDVKLGEGAFTGWQAKIGYALDGYQSNRQFPGGNWQHDPDWLLRPTWSHYPKDTKNPNAGRNPLRFGLYIYSTGDDRTVLPAQVWATPTRGGGYRRLVLFSFGPTPTEETWHRYRIHVDRPKTGLSTVTVLIDGTEIWSAGVSLLCPANRTGLQSAYGGSAAVEGPAYPVDIMYRRMAVTLG